MKMNIGKQTGRAGVNALVVVLLIGAGIYFVENIHTSMSGVIDAANRLSAMVSGNPGLDQKTAVKPNATSANSSYPVSGKDAAVVAISAERKQFLAQIEVPKDFIPSNAEGSIESAPFSRIDLPEIASGQRAINLLGEQLPVVAQWYGFSADTLKNMLLHDLSLHIDRHGRLLNIDDGVQAGAAINATMNPTLNATAAVITSGSVTNAIFPLDQTFKLESKPASTRVLYLNFKGLGAKPAFDLDKNTGTFSTTEQTMIQKIWARVKEDFAPFDVNVTTLPPTSTAGKIGTSILITNQVETAGGYAYLNSFGTINLSNPPAFCFQNNLANSEKPIAECISHELGHTLGLLHQGTATLGYYAGHGDGETGWAPIMGVGYYKNLTQWSKGEYPGANNFEDAYATMLKRGLNPRVDDVGNTIASAAAMESVTSNGLNNVNASGIIERVGDIDMFRFQAGPGNATITLQASAFSGNLDASVQLLDATGKVLASSNNPTTLGTTLTTTLTANSSYYLSVTGVGRGDPKTTGYSNYGSLGQYLITGTTPLIVYSAPVVVVKTSALTGKGPLSVSFDATKSTAMSGATVTKYEWNFGDATANSTAGLVTHTFTKVGTYTVTLKITDSNNQSKTQTMKVVVTSQI
ncbi:PKD domain-containing protein [Undibacterium flavidum]|uniref:PKD domain-containing protein n=1 Tax=Undibacterium flavidum TaxID=2762297 RepID=A0ABR6YH11_9BURK|nr:PKD domain-containing protein [Undibacterium flavidum]MBC3875874.1 PKD domain-containing protein [Undibacterium flavidum]